MSVTPDQWRRRMKFKFPGMLHSADAVKSRLDFISTDIIFYVDVSGNVAINDATFAGFLQTLWSEQQCDYVDMSETDMGPLCANNLGVLSTYCLKTLKMRKLKCHSSFSDVLALANKFMEGVEVRKPHESKVEVLDLSENHFMCLDIVRSCPGLISLNLQGVKLSTANLREIVSQLKRLQVLNLRGCELNASNLESVAQLESLKELDFSLNDLKDTPVDVLRKIVQLPCLESLFCGNCALQVAATSAIAQAIADKPLRGDVEGDYNTSVAHISHNAFLPEYLLALKGKGLAKGPPLPAGNPVYVGGVHTKPVIQVQMTEQEYEEFKLWKQAKERGAAAPAAVPSAAAFQTYWTPPGFVAQKPPQGAPRAY